MSATNVKYEYRYEEHSDECMDDANKQYEYRYEEHSDECMDDAIQLVYMSRANAIRASNVSATNIRATRNIVTSGVNKQ
jgi:hypothetical protein